MKGYKENVGSPFGNPRVRKEIILRITKELTSWSGVHLENLIFPQMIVKFSALFGTRKFITVFKRP